MARCIPEDPDFSVGQSAERAVWERLRAELPDDAVLAHSVQARLGTNEHEIDLLVLWPGVGLAAIEVKGGRVSASGGTWSQSDARGSHRIQNPLAQSQGSMHAFQRWIEERTGSRLSSRFAYLACLPYTDVPAGWESAGSPRSLFLDRRDVGGPLAETLRRVIETQGSGTTTLAASYVDRIAVHLAATLDTAEPPAGTAREVEDHQEHLTENQKVLLGATRSLRRVRFVGGAGSGKTWLALQKAKALCRDGKRVGLFCYNKGLGEYLRREVGTWRQARPVFTGEFHEYARALGVPDGAGQDYFDADMPALLRRAADRLPAEERLDAVVVDEAQDFAPLWWDALLACTREPETGEVYAFMDDRQDVYSRWDGAALGTGAAGAAAPLATIHVDDNLRNTRQIAGIFRPLAPENFTPRGGTGPAARLVACATTDALDLAGDCVDALIDEGWANNQIALLTTRHRHPVHQDHHEAGTTDAYWREFHDHEAEFYGHVLGFKGLERSVVVLCVDGFKDLSRAREQLYVGLSRARSLLVVVADPALLAEVGGRGLASALGLAQSWSPAARQTVGDGC